jgi:hypothetical protein
MKVRGTTSTRERIGPGAPSRHERAKKQTGPPPIEGKENKKVSFIEELREMGDLKTKEILDEVLGGIDEAARIFLERPIYENLLKYKELVQRFMRVVISKLYKTRERLSSRAIDPQKVYTLLEEVDKNLGLLTEEVLSGQAESLSLMARIDEIRGILVDLYS